MIRFGYSIAALGLFTALATAGEYNKVLSIGDMAPAWTDLPGTDGKKHSLADLKKFDVVVVVFTCNSCPAAVGYEDRIINFAKKHASGPEAKVAVVAINVNTITEDQLPQMKKRAEKKNLPYPYLYDESQKIAREFGAQYTPEFFVLNRDRKVTYMGALDETSNAADAKENFLEAAVLAALKGETPAKTETLARGCRIRYNRNVKD